MSMQIRKRWQVLPRASEAHFARFPDLPPLVVQILSNRGVTEPDEVHDFLSCRPSDETDPFLLKGMPEAVARLQPLEPSRHQAARLGAPSHCNILDPASKP